MRSQVRIVPGRPTAMALAVGLALGWIAATASGPSLHAGAGDRPDAPTIARGPVAVAYNPQLKTQSSQEAVYFLNYRKATLLATVPIATVGPAGPRVLGDFAERDLMADFGLPRGATPHFLLTTASLGVQGEGWDPLFVFETTTGQVATYRALPQASGLSSRPSLQLLDRRTDPRLASGQAPAVAEAR